MSLRQEIKELHYEISGEIDHGECFYSKKYLDRFLSTLDSLKGKSS